VCEDTLEGAGREKVDKVKNRTGPSSSNDFYSQLKFSKLDWAGNAFDHLRPFTPVEFKQILMND